MSYATCKSIADRILAAGALLGLSPLLALIAGTIALRDGRPILFTQPRAGQHGQPFRIYKFRTLHREPNDPTQPQAHCTRTGTFLRRWALDELPQLWNIVRGDMSFIGPRPTLLDQVRRYGAFERTRLQVKPGLTGWAQIHGRNALSWPERIELDVWYVRHQSLWVDTKILMHTPRVLWRGTGVYGRHGRNDSFSRFSS